MPSFDRVENPGASWSRSSPARDNCWIPPGCGPPRKGCACDRTAAAS